jgi:CheY-like chemotaxis protein
MEAGCDAHLSKPFTSKDLFAIIEQFNTPEPTEY